MDMDKQTIFYLNPINDAKSTLFETRTMLFNISQVL